MIHKAIIKDGIVRAFCGTNIPTEWVSFTYSYINCSDCLGNRENVVTALDRLAQMEVKAAHLRGIANITGEEFDIWLAETAESSAKALKKILEK